MDVGKVISLKDKGNKAYVDGNYDEAIGLYKEALNSAGSGDSNIAAILHSNISQTYLKKKDYLLAIESATKSLELDSSFMKSNLRRATANIELDNLVDAMTDLRLIFSSEPKNKAAKDLMRRCSDKPKMVRKLYVVYAKHYLRQVLKKLGAQIVSSRTGIHFVRFQNALLRQSLLSIQSLDISNYFFCGTFVGFLGDQAAFIGFSGWVARQLTWLKYPYYPIAVELSDKLFGLLYQLLRPGTFSMNTVGIPAANKTLLLNKYSDVYLAREEMIVFSYVDNDDLKLMNHYSNDLTRLLYHPKLVDLKNNKFSKARALTFCADNQITSDFLKLWKKNEWPIESLVFVHGVPDLQVFRQFNGVVSSDVKNVFVLPAKPNQNFNTSDYDNLCSNLTTLKCVFPNLDDVTITQRYSFKVQKFSRFVQNMALIREAYETFSTKPVWCSKLKVMIFVEFVADSHTEFKLFDVKLLEQAVGSLYDERLYVGLGLYGPRSYNVWWTKTLCACAVIEFENDVASFEVAFIGYIA